VSFATDEQVKDKAGDGGKRESKGKRPNPVVMEVPVSVAGARPAAAQDKRELFVEETTTVVIFKDGAVIQLSAAITVGQLLFLTDKRTKKEVVCQVVRKRSHRPTTCYVELEFPEGVENFWGMSFPEHEETEGRPKTAEVVEAQETTEDDRGEPPNPPKAEDVAQLKKDLEALGAQLRELKEKHASETEDRDAQVRRLAEAELAARAAAESEAKERAGEMERKALANAARLAEEARQRLAQAQSEPQAADPESKEEKTEPPLAEPKPAAKAAAETEAQQQSRAYEEEARKASEAAQKWELESIENERIRRGEEQARRERAEAERANPRLQQEAEDPAEVPQPATKIAMKLPTAAVLNATEAPATKVEATPRPVSAAASTGTGEADPLEDLLPKPALDFSKAPKALDPNDPYNIYKPLRRKAGWQEIAVAAVIVVILVGGGGYAWYRNWLPFLRRGPTVAPLKPVPTAKQATGSATPHVPPNATQTAPSPNGLAAPAATAANGQTAGNAAASRAANGAGGVTAESAAGTAAAAKNDTSAPEVVEKVPEKRALEVKGGAKKEAATKDANSKGGKKHGKAETSSESTPKPEEVAVAEDAPLIPAKLLHWVQPVYPPDAMRNYITGDVRIEAVVGPAGRVGAMQVLVGPAALRQAAMDALGQYEYAPATQGGKAVASKVTVTIKFWFDP